MGNLVRKIARKKKISLLNLMKNNSDLVDEMDKIQKHIAKTHKNAIIDSRLGAYLIKNAHTRIYVYAPLKIRVKRIAGRDKKNYKYSLKETLSREREELKHYKKEYNIDYRNKKLYNIIINTNNLTVKDTFKKILEKMKKIDYI